MRIGIQISDSNKDLLSSLSLPREKSFAFPSKPDFSVNSNRFSISSIQRPQKMRSLFASSPCFKLQLPFSFLLSFHYGEGENYRRDTTVSFILGNTIVEEESTRTLVHRKSAPRPLMATGCASSRKHRIIQLPASIHAMRNFLSNILPSTFLRSRLERRVSRIKVWKRFTIFGEARFASKMK